MDFLKIALMLAMTFFCVGVGFLMFVLGNDLFKDWKKQMNIEEIRAEISYVFTGKWKDLIEWIKENSEEQHAGFYIPGVDERNAASILVDMAYEAGKAQGHLEERIENRKAIKDAFNAGFEEGKAEIPECLECKSGDYEKGFKAGKAEAIVVPDNAAIAKADHDGFERGYAAAAKDPRAWCVLDKNDKQIHIGDQVKHDSGRIKTIKGLGEGGAFSTNTTFMNFKEWQKVIPDTRKKIKDELSDAIWYGWSECEIGTANNPEELAEQFISRIEALEVD